MRYKLFAFDLDGTLLRHDKSLSTANAAALREMESMGAIVALASGRLGSSVSQYAKAYGFEPALLTLNGAAVFGRASDGSPLLYSSLLDKKYARYLIDHVKNRPIALNYYCEGKLYAQTNDCVREWTDLYFAQTHTQCHFVESLDTIAATAPHKMLCVADPKTIDAEEAFFRDLWGDSVYIVRTWDYYLEFMNPAANKGIGLTALANSYNISMSNVVAFGDADNDLPMLEAAGLSCAMQNGTDLAKKHACYVSSFHHDDDAIAKEWEFIKAGKYDNQEKP